MPKLSKVYFLCLALLLAFSLTGCGQKSSSSRPSNSAGSSNQATSDNSSGDGGQIDAKQSFGQITEVELPDSPVLEIEGEIRPLLKNIFGDLKATSYSSDVYGAGSMIVEYTPSKKPAPAELPKVTKALKDKGYAATMEHVDSNVGTAMYEGSKYTLTVTINTANSVVGVSYIGK